MRAVGRGRLVALWSAVGPNLAPADAYATAATALGLAALAWLRELPGTCALLMGLDGTSAAIPDLPWGQPYGVAASRSSVIR